MKPIALGLVAIAWVPTATAELLTVQVDGKLSIYGVWYSDFFSQQPVRTPWPAILFPGRAIGAGGTGTYVDADGSGPNADFVEQRTQLGIRSNFTQDVAMYVELDATGNWGEDFRSNYVTGADGPGASIDDIEFFQAYIEADNMWGMPLRMRAGRQALAFGDEWLVGTNPDPDPFIQHSFDALRLTYRLSDWEIDAFAAVLAENAPREEDEDVHFYGLYGSYRGIPDMELDAYYFFLRDARSINDTNFAAPVEWLEDRFGIDDYDPTTIHTIGLRWTGVRGGLDWYAEGAYQWGDAGTLGAMFRPYGLYGDDDATYGNWAAVGEVGYTFDVAWQPRVFVAGAYYGAEDNRDLSFGEWLNPFDRPEASVSFNRLFGSQRHTHFLDTAGLTNFWFARAGVEAQVTEKLSVYADVMYHEILEPFHAPAYVRLGRYRLPIAPALSFWTKEGATDLGVEVMVKASYAYNDNLELEAGFVQYVVGDAFDDGVFFDNMATTFIGGSGSENAQSVFFQLTTYF